MVEHLVNFRAGMVGPWLFSADGFTHPLGASPCVGCREERTGCEPGERHRPDWKTMFRIPTHWFSGFFQEPGHRYVWNPGIATRSSRTLLVSSYLLLVVPLSVAMPLLRKDAPNCSGCKAF